MSILINNIQILRGLAALWVFLFHSLGHFKAMGLTWVPFEWVASQGYAGVDVFFVISGLVMAKTTEHLNPGWQSGRTFISKRFLRIYLGYWPIFLFTAAVIWYYQPALLTEKDLLASVFLTSTNMFEILIPPAWSLPFELYFYFLIGLLLCLKINRVHGLFATLVVLILAKLMFLDYGFSAVLDLLLSPMIFEFLFGYYLWLFKDYLLKLPAIVWLLLAVLSLYLAISFELINTAWRPFTYGVFSLALVALSLQQEGKLHRYVVNLLKPMGDASYTLYLFHYVALFLLFATGLRTYLVDHQLSAVGFGLFVLLVIMISYGVYRLVEKPLYQKTRKRVQDHHKATDNQSKSSANITSLK